MNFLVVQYGRHAVADIAKEIEGKTEADVKRYSTKFWKRYQELNDAERIIKNIERGEQRIQRQQDIMTALASKLERYRNPWQELRLQYGTNKGKAYTGQKTAASCLEAALSSSRTAVEASHDKTKCSSARLGQGSHTQCGNL